MSARHDDPSVPAHRLFVAVALPPDAAAAIATLVERVRADVDDGHPGVRWVRLDGIHLTLRFLGATTPDRLDAVSAGVRAAAAAAATFRVGLSGAGAFPSVARPRVLWLGVTGGTDALGALAADVEAGMVRAGFPPEGRPFRPHLTIARADGVRAGPRTAARLVELAGDLDVGWTVDHLTLFESHLGGGPARYERLLDVPLGSAGGTVVAAPAAPQ
jgi:2'-5' RNA ligase